MKDLLLLAINLTRRCNLSCVHCYLDADTLLHSSDNELTTKEVCHLLDEVVTCGDGTMVVLTGGEPLVRRDLEQIIAHGTKLELAMVVGTNGMMLTERRVTSLKDSGLLGAGISVDSLDAEKHDNFRGQSGAWEKTMAGIEQCRRQQLSFQIHFTITDNNADELAAMIDFARSSGALVLNIFFLVCTGRGESFSNIQPERYERVLAEIIDAQSQYPDLIIRPRCAPHFKRIAFQKDPDSLLNRISGQEGDGCIAGTHYCRVTPEGGITACPYIDTEVGNIHQTSFTDSWKHAPDFLRLRKPKLNGRCGNCEYRQLCGGCRARPVAAGNDLMDTDPWCTYEPQGGGVIIPYNSADSSKIHWSQQAEQRLGKIPRFLRKMIKKRAEAYVIELGEHEVTATHLSSLAARRFGNNMPTKSRPRRPGA